MNVSPFDRSRLAGSDGETRIALHFRRWFDVEIASRDEDRSGVDMWFGYGGLRIPVQVKTEALPAKTNNFFIETVSNDRTGAPGWALTPRADFVLYYVPPWNTVFVIPMRFITDRLAEWKRRYATRPTRDELNNGYQTWGICVPVAEFADCEKVRLRTESDG